MAPIETNLAGRSARLGNMTSLGRGDNPETTKSTPPTQAQNAARLRYAGGWPMSALPGHWQLINCVRDAGDLLTLDEKRRMHNLVVRYKRTGVIFAADLVWLAEKSKPNSEFHEA